MLKLGITLVFCLALIVLHIFANAKPAPSISSATVTCYHKAPNYKIWCFVIFTTCIILYILLALLISTAWLQGDEYLFVPGEQSIYKRLESAYVRWKCWNGRLGDILAEIISISENRYQQFLITPLFAVATPFALYELIKRKGETILSKKGFLYIVFTIAILTISVQTRPWRNFWDFAASANYLWPCVIICYFISFYKSPPPVNANTKKILLTFALFVMGVYSGWSLECITVFLIPGLLIWLFCYYRSKRHVPIFCLSGITGALLGATLLFSSSGFSTRCHQEMAHRTLKIEELTNSELWSFVMNHSPENMAQLKGETVAYFLKGIPLYMHVFYLPELLKAFLECCTPVLLACLIMLVFLIKTTPDNKRPICVSCLLLALSFLMACSYLYAVIPTHMSFLPPSFILIILSGYLFLRIKSSHTSLIQASLALCAFILALVELLPGGIEAWNYKKYEAIRRQEIQRQVYQGIEHIVLPAPYPTPPNDKLGLISQMDLKQNPKAYPNTVAAKVYGVSSISQSNQ